MEIVIIYLILCGLIGAMASGRGRSGLGLFFLALITSPILGVILLLIVGRSKPMPVQIVNAEQSPTARLEELGRLRSNGIITDAEFEAKKADLLARI